VQNFTPLTFSTVEKSVTVQKKPKQNDKSTNKHSKLSIPHTIAYGGIKTAVDAVSEDEMKSAAESVVTCEKSLSGGTP